MTRLKTPGPEGAPDGHLPEPTALAPPSATAVNGGSAAPPAPPRGSGRTRGGRFAKGNTLSKGNPFYRRQCELRQALLACVTAEAVRAYGEKLLALAMEGDAAAGKLLLSYALGRPGAAPDPDRQDLHEWALLAASPTAAEATAVAFDNLPLREVLGFCKGFVHLAEVAQQTVLADGEDEADRLEAARRRRLHHGPPRG
jgi:hypothetical protein